MAGRENYTIVTRIVGWTNLQISLARLFIRPAPQTSFENAFGNYADSSSEGGLKFALLPRILQSDTLTGERRGGGAGSK